MKVICLFLLLFSRLASAESHDVYAFKTIKQQAEFNTIVKDLRCLVCQNQDLNDSHAEFAENLRKKIHQWVLEGKSQKEILQILTSQYGDFILFSPPIKKTTYILWAAPFFIFAIAIMFLLITIYSRSYACKSPVK